MKNFGLKSPFFYLCLGVMLIALFFIFRSKHIEGYPVLQETDREAQNFGYRADAKKVDKKKFPSYVSGQVSGNSAMYMANVKECGESSKAGTVALFPNKCVPYNSWYSAWSKKG